MTRWWRRRAGDDRGAVTVMTVVFVPVVLMFVGLVYEGGEHLAARRDAFNAAAGAARAGAQALDQDSMRVAGDGRVNRLEQAGARARVEEYMGEVAGPGCHLASVAVTVEGARPSVTARVVCDAPSRLLSLLPGQVEGEATACAEVGVAAALGECD